MATNDDIINLLHGVTARLDAIEGTVKEHGTNLHSLAKAALQNSQEKADAFQAQMTTQLAATNKVVEDLQRRLHTEGPSRKQKKTDQDVMMADAAATPVPQSPPQAPTTSSHMPTHVPQHTSGSTGTPRQAPPRHNTTGTSDEDGYVVLVIFPRSVVKTHMKKHYQVLLDDLPRHVSDDAVLRPPPEGTTFGVCFSCA